VSAAQHTPGPWAIDETWLYDKEHPEWRAIVSNFDEHYNRMSVSGHIGGANARLIAAAPELLEALKACRLELWYCQSQLASHGQTGCEGDSVSRALKAGADAIARATGADA